MCRVIHLILVCERRRGCGCRCSKDGGCESFGSEIEHELILNTTLNTFSVNTKQGNAPANCISFGGVTCTLGTFDSGKLLFFI